MVVTRNKNKRERTDEFEAIINLLGVVFSHRKSDDGGDLYLTEFGLKHTDLLRIENWYERQWFAANRVRLTGTSSVFRTVTKEVDNRALQLVVKNNRVGEDVPLNTHTLMEFINAEFNSPWEEFALTMELRENSYGPQSVTIKTQQPLAIYVPPEEFQLWQTGRSREKINKINRKHPSINLDILRQYKMVYKWIDGLNIVEMLMEIGVSDEELNYHLIHMTDKSIRDLEDKGFVVADMKPSHIIIDEKHVRKMRRMGKNGSVRDRKKQVEYIRSLVDNCRYSLIDYELLMRTPPHEEEVKSRRRHLYLDDQRDRFKKSKMPPFLKQSEIMGVPYVHGHVESTGGLLWVVGCNPRLFDYFLPERWRKTPCQPYSSTHDVFYTVTKDNIHIVWKTSRVGENVASLITMRNRGNVDGRSINCPFEEIAIAHHLSSLGILTVYARAIYMTGSAKNEASADNSHYLLHQDITAMDNYPILREFHDYITIWGYYNGSDSWVAAQNGTLCTPYDLERAARDGLMSADECRKALEDTVATLDEVGYDGSLLELNDILITVGPQGHITLDAEEKPETRICSFELIRKKPE